VIKRTIKPAAGKSRVTAAAAAAAAHYVYRDRVTGKFVISKQAAGLTRRPLKEPATRNGSTAAKKR
jgi:hypothetical protein